MATENQNTNPNETDKSNGLFGSKEQLKSLMSKAKNEYLAQHQDVVNEYLKTNPNANTLDILNHIRMTVETNDTGPGISLNCLFFLVVGIIVIIALRIQYNIYVEEFLISSLFFSLNPSINIDLLLNDLTLKIDKCELPKYIIKNKDNKKWINNNIEYCDLISMSVNRKLLYMYEYSSNNYKQNNNNLYTFIQWILNERFNIQNKNKKKQRILPMPLNAIESKEHIQQFVLSHMENIKYKWNIYVNNVEKKYAKKNTIDLDNVLYRLGIEITHYIFTNSLYDNNMDKNNENKNVIKDILDIIDEYLQYEYFRDGFICIKNDNIKQFTIEFVHIYELIKNKNIQNYLDLIKNNEMKCINTFEHIGRFKNEIKIYLQIIKQCLNHWIKIPNSQTDIIIIDNNKNIKMKLLKIENEYDNKQIEPYWNTYEWLKGGGLSIESLVIHNKLIYTNTNNLHLKYDYMNEKGKFIDIKYYMKDIKAQINDKLLLFYTNNYMFHRYFFEQFKLKEMSKEMWSEVTQFLGVINRQFGGVMELTQQIIKYINNNYIYYNSGFLWMLCGNKNNKLYFKYTLRYDLLNENILKSNDGIVMVFDLWSHSFYNDFINGYKLKYIEYTKINKKKYKTKEIIGQAIDIKHIGTSLQKTFNFPRSKMEVFGYYLTSLVHNLDWIKIAKRWEVQCKNKGSYSHVRDRKSKKKIENDDEIIKPPQHGEL